MDVSTEYRRNSQSMEHTTSASSSLTSVSNILSLLDGDRNDSTSGCDQAAFGLVGNGWYFSFDEDLCLLVNASLLSDVSRIIKEPIRLRSGVEVAVIFLSSSTRGPLSSCTRSKSPSSSVSASSVRSGRFSLCQ
jgi:hypothetical protein